MIRSKIRKYEMLAHVADFAGRNVSLFPKKTVAIELTNDIQAAVERLSETKAAQAAATNQLQTCRIQRQTGREALRGQVLAIHQIADALKMPGFPLPDGPKDSALFDTARNYASAIGDLKPQFVLHGLPANFVENLKSATDELAGA